MENITADEQKTATLRLTDDLLIGSGDNRACYRHPDNPARCVKVHRSDGSAARKHRRSPYRLYHMWADRRKLSHNEQEWKNYLTAFRKVGDDLYRFLIAIPRADTYR